MLPVATLLAHSLLYGAILSVLLSALVLGTLAWRPMIWSGDLPAETRAAVGPMSAADRRARRWVALLLLLILVAVLGAAMAGLARLGGGTLRFTDAAVATFLIFMSFNLVDLLFIDWLLLVKLRAPLFTIPGAELPAVYGDYGYHGRGFLKGTLGIALLSPLLAALAVLIW